MKYQTSDGRPLRPEQVARLDEIEARIGDSVAAPPAPDANWATAVRGKHLKATQDAISVCLDPDVHAWLRAKGPGYQTEINHILRERMLAEGEAKLRRRDGRRSAQTDLDTPGSAVSSTIVWGARNKTRNQE